MKMTKKNITQKELKELLSYDPDTGHFTNLVTRCRSTKGTRSGGTSQIGYWRTYLKGKLYGDHVLAYIYMTGNSPEHEIDHINHDRSDNRWVNLRPTTHRENHKNRRMHSNNTTGKVGVGWNKRDKSWRAEIKDNDKRISLYWGNDFFEACCQRISAENRLDYHVNHGRGM